MTILRKIENPSGDNTGFVEKIQHENNAETSGVATSNYNDLKDKPLINGVILQGRLSLDDLYIQEKGDYAKANEIPTKVSELENDKGYVTEVPTKISELENDKNYITEYTETDPTIPQHIKDIKEEDIVSWNAKSEFSGNYDDLNNKPEIPSIAGLATEEYVNNAISKIPPTDLTGYATLDDVDDAITEIVGSAPETLDTLAELAEGLVANKNVVEVLNDAIVDKVNRTELHAVAMSGSYNDLINQPEGLATEQYVDDAIANASSGNVDCYVISEDLTSTENLKTLQTIYDAYINDHKLVNAVYDNAKYGPLKLESIRSNSMLFSSGLKATHAGVSSFTIETYCIDLTINDNTIVSARYTNQTNNKYLVDYSSDISNKGSLSVDNTKAFTPTGNYHPATKKYVDDSIANIEIPKEYVYMETSSDSFVHGGDTIGFTRTENRTAFVQAVIKATAEYTKTGTVIIKDKSYHDYTILSVVKNGSQNGKEKVAFKYVSFSPSSSWIGYPYKLYTGNGELLITTAKTWSSISITSKEYDLDSFTTTTYVDNAISSAIGDIESLLGGI